MRLKSSFLRRRRPILLVVSLVGVALLSGAAGAVAASHMFSDVPDDHHFADQIAWLAESGVSQGFEDGTFRPGAPVTRQAMAAFLHRLAGQDPDVGTVVDAATVQGMTPEDLEGAQGPAGPQGPTGPRGPKGDTGDAVLANLTCTTDQIIRWDGTAWVCGSDADTLAGLNCTTNQSVGWDGTAWVCRSAPITATLSTAASPSPCCLVNERFDAWSRNVDDQGWCEEFQCEISLLDVLDHRACSVSLSGTGAQGADIVPMEDMIRLHFGNRWFEGESLYVNVSCVS